MVTDQCLVAAVVGSALYALSMVDHVDYFFAGDVASRLRSKSAHGRMATSGVDLQRGAVGCGAGDA